MSKLGFAELKTKNIMDEMGKGRGFSPVLPYPIALEPTFQRFSHHQESQQNGFLQKLFNRPMHREEQVEYPQADINNRLGFIDIRPNDDRFDISSFEQFILSINLGYPISFEVIANAERISIQLAVDENDIPVIINIIQAHFPEFEAVPQADFLEANFDNDIVMAVYCLTESHFFPLTVNNRLDPYAVLLSNLNSITYGMAGLQVIFVPVKNNWAENMLQASRSDFDPNKSAFADIPQLPRIVAEKVSYPLFVVSVRLIASDLQVFLRMESFLQTFGNEYNGFTRIHGNYPIDSILMRANYCPGMILNSKELAGLVHLPNSISIPKLVKPKKSAPAPPLALASEGISFGENYHQGVINPVTINQEWLTRHVAIFGGTGSGKTNLLGHIFSQLILSGGSAFIDPNGDAALDFLSLIPLLQLDEVIYFDPVNFPLSINPMAITDPQQIEQTTVNLLISLKRLFDLSSWGPRLEWILRKTVKTLLLSGNKTLLDIPRIFNNKDFRREVLASITDADLIDFWGNMFPKLSQSTLIPILNKLSVFLDSDIIKPIVSRQKSDINFAEIINNKKIFIANLSKGKLGEINAHILGSFILSGFQQSIMARSVIPKQQRKFFSLIIDEFHAYADSANVESINSLLSEARKYNVSLITATQYLNQVDRRIKDAIFGNIGTLISLKVGVDDAQNLQREMGQFGAEDLLNLNIGEAIVRLGRAQDSFNLKIPLVKRQYIDCTEEILKRAEVRSEASMAVSGDRVSPRPIVPTAEQMEKDTTIKEPYPKQAENNLTKDEYDFLKFIYQKEDITPFRELGEETGRSIRQIYNLVADLSQKAFITDTKLGLSSGGRKARVILITAEGIKALGYTNQGKGGALHQYFQRIIKSYAEKQGYQTKIEKPLANQQSVDLHLEKGGEKIAIEISINTDVDDEFSNIQKCLSAGYDRIITLCLKETTLTNLQNRITQTLPAEVQSKIFVSQLDNLFQFVSHVI